MSSIGALTHPHHGLGCSCNTCLLDRVAHLEQVVSQLTRRISDWTMGVDDAPVSDASRPASMRRHPFVLVWIGPTLYEVPVPLAPTLSIRTSRVGDGA